VSAVVPPIEAAKCSCYFLPFLNLYARRNISFKFLFCIIKWLLSQELAVDPSFEFEKRRNIPVKYDRELWTQTITAMQVILMLESGHIIVKKRSCFFMIVHDEKGLHEFTPIYFDFLMAFQAICCPKLAWFAQKFIFLVI
jgi:hypothetical protein